MSAVTGTGDTHPRSGMPEYMQHLPDAEFRPDRAPAQALPALLCGIGAFLCAVLAIPAIALAITSWRRSRPDQRRGRVLAAVAVGLSVLAIGVWLALGASWWQDRHKVHTVEFGADGEKVGQCMDFAPDSPGWSRDAGMVDCAQPHAAQVVANLQLPAWRWTNTDDMVGRFQQTCADWVQPMLASRDDSFHWQVNALVPRYEADWIESHIISCVVEPRSGRTSVDLAP
jgi:hypothetical protein